MTDPTFRFFGFARRGTLLAGGSCALILAAIAAPGCSSKSVDTNDESDTGGASDTGASTDTAKGDTATGDTNTGSDTAVGDTGTTTDTGTATDGGTDTATTTDGPVDGATDGSGDAARDGSADGSTDVSIDAGPAPLGTKIATGDFSLQGVTTDGYAIVTENISNALQAIPLAGGAAVTIDAASSSVAVRGKVVFSWHAVDTNGIGGLTTWTASGGVKATATTTFADVAAANADGSTIAYLDAATAAGPANMVFSLADGTGKKTLDAVNLSFCAPDLRYAAARPIASYCATSATVTVASWDVTGGTKVTLQTTGKSFSTDTAGTKVFLVSASGAASVIPITGGTATAVDTGVAAGAMLPDGTGVVYRMTAESIKRSPLPTVAPITLVTSGAKSFLGISPDGANALYRNAFVASSRLSDLFMASTLTPGTPTTLNAATTTDPTYFGDTFTTDNSRVMFATDVDTTTGLASLKVKPVASGSISTISTAAWWAMAATGSKIVFDDGFVAGSSTTPSRGDIRIVDAATTAAATLLVTKADAFFLLSPAKDKLVYTYTFVPANQGLYVGALP